MPPAEAERSTPPPRASSAGAELAAPSPTPAARAALPASSADPVRARRLRVEDWLLAGWMAIVAPWSIHVQPGAGIFDGGRPLDGIVGLVALLGVAVCVATRTVDAAGRPGVTGMAAIGPFAGGLLLTEVSTVAALELPEAAAAAFAVVCLGVAIAVRRRWPALAGPVRRALMTPYILVAGGLFWSLIDTVTGGGGLTTAVRTAALQDLAPTLPIIGFLVAFSAVHYAMLVYAPRQVADAEGGALAWLARYALFVASIAVGAGWLRILAG